MDRGDSYNRRTALMTMIPPYTITSTILEAVQDFSTTDQARGQVTDQVSRLLANLRNGPKSATELMAALGLSHRPTFPNNYIHPALSVRLVEMTGPESPAARNQKYQLTARGRIIRELSL